MEFALLFPPTQFLGDLWLESLSLPWLGLSLEKTRVLKGLDHFYHLALWEILSGARAPDGVLCPMHIANRRKAETLP